ncbi:AP2-like ethylene-responsive transcription factor CRL5 isoform X2 [Rhodamnia argentea]|uniref:AP2-like ethylene-responsive transcription factor CRL5 isoform X2 n=1 Tax=Rhodamnia argentea TaxID=178133 RepID=A0A8B8PT61_9MYRT|nr:AP2-like ethylene-responsive transcription factor CRL5 isoform X2 [Rhodamnia argentea]
MKMDVSSSQPHHQHHHPYCHQARFPSVTTDSGSVPLSLSYEVGEVGNAGFFHPPLCAMPVKSDGSLCLMEALTRSQPEGMMPSSAPKLEDFLGVHYNGRQDGEAQLRYSELVYRASMEEETNGMSRLGNLVGVDDCAVSGSVSVNGKESGGFCPQIQSGCVALTAPRQFSPAINTESLAIETRKRALEADKKLPVPRKSIDTFGQRTSQYRGVTRHRWTGRYEAHLWDNSCKKEGQSRKGRQVYLGGYDTEEKAARAYDLAALKYWGPSTHINFSLENYRKELEEMKTMSRLEYIAHLRRRSSGFSRGASIYRGVTRHHQHGRWQARIGRVTGNKDLYLGTFTTQEEAAEAYDIAAIKFRGVNAVTNFNVSRYDVEKIMTSNTLLAGELVRRNKEAAPGYDMGYLTSGVANGPESIDVNGQGWKMVLHESPRGQPDDVAKSLDQNSIARSNQISSLSMALQHISDEGNRGRASFADPSSTVTSLGSSQDDAPDRTCLNMLLGRPVSAPEFTNAPGCISSWLHSTRLIPAPVNGSRSPVFTALSEI